MQAGKDKTPGVPRSSRVGPFGIAEFHSMTSAEAGGGAIGAVAHAAYHLGAIRQKVAVGRTGCPR
jgi:hypothetical protein